MNRGLFNINSLKPFVKSRQVIEQPDSIVQHHLRVRSKYLARKVVVDIFLPPSYQQFRPYFYPALIMNDGQDMEQLRLVDTLGESYRDGRIAEIVVIAVHAGDRLHEYGTAGKPDYMNRGSKAADYAQFIIKELVPYIYKHFRCLKNPEDSVIAGFSLGGLSAMDIAWNYSRWFSKVGVFSGSFWWRDKGMDDTDLDAYRIMHDIIKSSERREELSFYLQTGTADEQCDRNNNGIIDSIDDTLDIIKELKGVGYEDTSIAYREIEGGEHNFRTWSEVFPDFLVWAFGSDRQLSEKSA
ncbi:MAG: alpha/beta hydrolase-fold protein [Cyclobacteriaceae bacterium]